jgi:hypothetical protein
MDQIAEGILLISEEAEARLRKAEEALREDEPSGTNCDLVHMRRSQAELPPQQRCLACEAETGGREWLPSQEPFPEHPAKTSMLTR